MSSAKISNAILSRGGGDELKSYDDGISTQRQFVINPCTQIWGFAGSYYQ